MTGIPVPALATADVCDNQGPAAMVVPLEFRDFGGRMDFAGPAATLKTLDDNTKVRTLLESNGGGRVLVIDGGGSRRHALLGGNLAKLAATNGWAGLVIVGCIRDSHELAVEPVGIKALGTCPRKTEKLDRGEENVLISLGGVIIAPGDWITADADGIVVTKSRPDFS